MTKKHLFQNGLALFVCLFLFAGAVFAQTQPEVVQVKNDGTWTVPSDVNVTSVTFEAWGGGGAGGYAYSTNSLIRATGGGGGGAYAKVTVDNPTANEVFNITVGKGGHATGSYTETPDISDGGNSVVTRGGNEILKAVGGKTVTGYKNGDGGMGGSKDACIGTVKYSGGNGADACPGLLGAWSTSGGGGGGAGTSANGSDGGTEVACSICLTHCTKYNVESVGAGGAGNPNGNGGVGKKTRIFSGDGWVNIQGGNGQNYGGGGGGSISGHISAGDANGGQGGDGIVIITYTYSVQSITVEDAEEYLCSNATDYTSYNIPLNIQTSGFQVKDANPNNIGYDNIVAETGLDYTTPTISYNNDEATWYIRGTFRNNTNNTLTLTIPATAFAPSGTVWDEYTVTIHAYGKLDGGFIQKNQYLCYQQEVSQLVNVASATGGKNSANPTYQWSYSNTYNGTYTPIDGATNEYYTPTQTGGQLYYKRAVVDECGTAYAHDNDYQLDNYIEILNPNPMDPGMIEEESPTICGNEPFYETIYSHFSGAIPEGSYGINIYWQRKVNDGDWEYISGAVSTGYVVGLTPGDGLMVPGNVIQYRYMVSLMEGYATCERIPSNNVYTVRVGGLTDYTGQFPDVNITLWYGACDTSIANLPAPTLDPTPVSITRVDNLDRVGVEPGEYTITWSVVADDCGGTVEYNQTVKVEYPACGTLEQPMTAFDEDGNEYQTIRIGCDCWFAENLKSYSENSSYYEEDAANEAFGKLYPWSDAVGSNNEERATMLGTTYIQGICPDGWAIPTVAQYMTMMNVAGSAEDVKSDDENAWLPGEIGTNTSGFAAMGAGFFEGMQYQRLRGYTDFWTADLNASNSTVAKATELRIGCDDLVIVDKNKANKLSVRCVRVEPVEPEEFTCGVSTVKDANGNTYSTVLIGEQCWTKSNLRAKKYADGSFISNTTYFIDPSYTNPAYGYLYTWDAVSNTAGLCPTGWHVSTKEDWQTLGNNISSNKDIAAKSGWLVSTNENMIGYEQESSNNSTGFSAFPAGQFNTNSYQSANRLATFWTNTEYNENNAWFVSLNALMSTTWPTAAGMKTWGRSVRCVKNAE